MAPKRRAASAAKAGGKKAKKEPDTPKPKDAFTSAKEALLAAGPQVRGRRMVDEACELSGSGEVYEDYDCMLNQTNVGQNNNKFYVIQVIEVKNGKRNTYYSWNRWGRVGGRGQSKLSPFDKVDGAIKDFERKFKDKTKNNWSDREAFVSHPGKYTLIEVDGWQDSEFTVISVDGRRKNVLPCSLDKATEHLMQLIFSEDMLEKAMKCMNLDIKKMPLGKLSKLQIAKGFEVLEEIEGVMNGKKRRARLTGLSSKFYTTLLHNFGRKQPPVIYNMEIVEQMKEMLTVLVYIVVALIFRSEAEKAQEEMIENVPHPQDQNYQSLKCSLTLMDKKAETFKIIKKYLKATAGTYRVPKILNVWEVDREAEGERFSQNDKLENRRLLWHGTSIASVEGILKSGLRIMPDSGGRVGRGIYFASENKLSAGYVRTFQNTGVMFLSEVALGKEHTITMDDSSLRKAPEGHDSVVARGKVEPDPSEDIVINLEGKEVSVPQGEPIEQPQYEGSSFENSEYVIYKANQCRLRFLVELEMNRPEQELE